MTLSARLPLLLAACCLAGAGCGRASGAAEPARTVQTSAAAAAAELPEHPPVRPTARTTTPPASPVPATPVTVAFAGDVHFEGGDAVRLAHDPATAIGPMAGVLSGADVAMVNLETAVTTRGTPAAKAFTFRAPPTAFTALRSAGIDVATMANNHGEDYGPVGLADTLAAAKAAHFPVVGIGADQDAAFAPYDVTVRGQRIAIIAATQVLDSNLAAAWTAGPHKPGLASAYDVPRLLAAVRAARASADTVVVYLHWGRELAACPIPAQRTLARQLVDAGADIVVGAHAHVQLGAGRLGTAFVDYGLGNFVFYAHGGGAVTRSGVLLLTVAGRTVTGQRWVPAQLEGGVAVPLAGAAAAAGLSQWDELRACTGLAEVG